MHYLQRPVLSMVLCRVNGMMVFLSNFLSVPYLFLQAEAVGFVDTENLLEALFEVVREEGVEERVGAGVDVGEDDQEEVDGRGGFVLRDDVDQVDDVGGEEGKPTNHKHQHNDHHHAGHLTLRSTMLRPACTHTYRPHLEGRQGEESLCVTVEVTNDIGIQKAEVSSHLNDNEQVAEGDDHQGAEEAQDGCVEDEDNGPQFMWLRPGDVAGVQVLLHV